MRKLLLILLVLTAGCKEREVMIKGEKYLIAENPFHWIKGLSEYEKKPKGVYRGMIFVFPEELTLSFHTENFKHYVLLCNFENKVKENCKCLKPNTKVKVRGRVFLEELYVDSNCTELIRF